jgi:cell pole-organizing protein PopZ
VDAIPAPAAEAARPILSFPERSTPLFGAQPDNLRPIVTSAPDRRAEPEQAAVAAEVVPKAEIAAVDAGQPSAASEAASSDGDEADIAPAATAVPDLLQAAAAGNGKPLEDMIAAVLEPVLQKLIETSIGPRLEELVRQEVERVLKSQRAAE